MPPSIDYATVVQELVDRKAIYLGPRVIDGQTFKLYRVGVDTLQPELVGVNEIAQTIARGATLPALIAVKNGGTPTDPPIEPQRGAQVPGTSIPFPIS